MRVQEGSNATAFFHRLFSNVPSQRPVTETLLMLRREKDVFSHGDNNPGMVGGGGTAL